MGWQVVAPGQEMVKIDIGYSQVLSEVTFNVSADASTCSLLEEFAGDQVTGGSRIGVLDNVDNLDNSVKCTCYTSQLIKDQ